MRAYAAAVYLFLYTPIVLIVLFSFNAGRSGLQFFCCSIQWYGRTLGNSLMVEALTNSLIIASVSASLATVMGTMAALALQRLSAASRVVYDALIYSAIIIPGIVIGIATLVALNTAFGLLNPLLAAFAGAGSAPTFQLTLGRGSVIAAHTLFSMALVIVIVRARISGMDRSLIEASADLYATPWRTFRQVTLPQLLPAVISGFLLSLTFSFDDFVVAFFVAGPTTTLPIYLFSSIRRGVTPEINVIATGVMTVSL
ncbi:MAG: ABC transporter permease, partial [Rhodospirillales bacterium]|nr:ABC transporter permease [Rhodospirillales bacterium]